MYFTVGKEWYKSTTLQDNPGESDVAIAHTLYNRYLSSTQLTSGLASFNITLNLDTNHVRGFLFNARAKLTWPRVTKPEINTFERITGVNWMKERLHICLVSGSKTDSPSRILGRLSTCGPRKNCTIW